MFFPYGTTDVTTCPNCGAGGWKDKKKDYECEKCGFHKVEAKDEGDCQPTFCEGCGCTFSNPCTLHPADQQRPAGK